MLKSLGGSQSFKKKHLKITGTILGSRKIREEDKLVYIFSREFGKLKGIAKGALKPHSKFTGIIETLNTCSIELYQGPKNLIITEIRLEKSPKNIRTNYKKIAYSLLLAKITNDLTYESDTQSETNEEIYLLLQEHLKELDKAPPEKALIIASTFIIKFLNILGLLPNFKDSYSFHTTIALKYRKLLQFLKDRLLKEIIKIALKPDEEETLKTILKTLIEQELDKKIELP